MLIVFALRKSALKPILLLQTYGFWKTASTTITWKKQVLTTDSGWRFFCGMLSRPSVQGSKVGPGVAVVTSVPYGCIRTCEGRVSAQNCYKPQSRKRAGEAVS